MSGVSSWLAKAQTEVRVLREEREERGERRGGRGGRALRMCKSWRQAY
jgi:hypothetical protein